MVAPVDSTGLLAAPRPVLETDWHLSYPHVFRHEDTIFMIPESGGNGRIDLYAATSFPYEWRHVSTLLEGVHAYDATVMRHDGRWWIFAAVTDGAGLSDYDELHLFYSDDLLKGPWNPHPLNPVLSDVTGARPAGAILRQSGRLLRPAQDSRSIYGRGLVMHEITMLSPEAFEERPVERLLPAAGSPWRGLHTFNTAGGLAAIDLIVPARHRTRLTRATGRAACPGTTAA